MSLTPSTSNAVLGTAFNISWQKTGDAGSCTASEDGAGNGGSSWSGDINGTSGALAVTETTGTSHAYDVSCTGDYGTVTAETVVNFTPAASSTGGGSGGSTGGGTASSKGGGGALDGALLAALAGLMVARRRVCRATGRTTTPG